MITTTNNNMIEIMNKPEARSAIFSDDLLNKPKSNWIIKRLIGNKTINETIIPISLVIIK
jgi:hypothetical protein